MKNIALIVVTVLLGIVAVLAIVFFMYTRHLDQEAKDHANAHEQAYRAQEEQSEAKRILEQLEKNRLATRPLTQGELEQLLQTPREDGAVRSHPFPQLSDKWGGKADACKTKSDCVPAPRDGNCCSLGCGAGYTSKKFAIALSKHRAQICENVSCYGEPRCSTWPTEPVCKNGQCETIRKGPRPSGIKKKNKNSPRGIDNWGFEL